MINNQRGDTLIEVLFATVILSTVLVATFALSSRAGTINRSSQERTEAIKVAETQRELVRFAEDSDISAINGNGCMELLSSGNNPVDVAYTTNTNDCLNATRYNIRLDTENVNGDRVFVTRVTWESLRGGDDNVELRWKQYE